MTAPRTADVSEVLKETPVTLIRPTIQSRGSCRTSYTVFTRSAKAFSRSGCAGSKLLTTVAVSCFPSWVVVWISTSPGFDFTLVMLAIRVSLRRRGRLLFFRLLWDDVDLVLPDVVVLRPEDLVAR